jgi:hypothetical protein
MLAAAATTTVTNLVTYRRRRSCRVIESLRGCDAAAQAAGPRGFLLLRVATRVTRTHSPRRASLGMVRPMITTASLVSSLTLRCTPCGFRSDVSAWRRTAQSWHVTSMRQTIPTIHAASCASAMIGSIARVAPLAAAAVIIRDCRRRGTDSREAESC